MTGVELLEHLKQLDADELALSVIANPDLPIGILVTRNRIFVRLEHSASLENAPLNTESNDEEAVEKAFQSWWEDYRVDLELPEDADKELFRERFMDEYTGMRASLL